MNTYLEPYEIRRNTEKFRSTYCFPSHSKRPRATVTNAEHINLRFEAMMELYQGVDKREIKRYIRSKYGEKNLYGDTVRGFLSTYYWEVIRTKLKLDAGWECSTENCESKSPLVVHHKTYEHWGEELDYLEDLVVLCQDCHIIEHRKQDKLPYQPYKTKRKYRKRRKSFGYQNPQHVVFKIPDEEQQLKETEKKIKDFHDKVITYKNKAELVVVVESKTIDELWDIIDSHIAKLQKNLETIDW